MKRLAIAVALLTPFSPLAQADALSRKDIGRLQLIEHSADGIYALAQSPIEPIEITLDMRAGSIVATQKTSLTEARNLVDLSAMQRYIKQSGRANLAWTAAKTDTRLDLQALVEANPYRGKDRCGGKQQRTELAGLLTVEACMKPNDALRCVASKDQFDSTRLAAEACLAPR